MSAWAGQQIKEKYQNGCHLKTTSQNHQIFDKHVWRTYVHMYTKYEVLCVNLYQVEMFTDDANANDDEQSMKKDSLIDKPNEPESKYG